MVAWISSNQMEINFVYFFRKDQISRQRNDTRFGEINYHRLILASGLPRQQKIDISTLEAPQCSIHPSTGYTRKQMMKTYRTCDTDSGFDTCCHSFTASSGTAPIRGVAFCLRTITAYVSAYSYDQQSVFLSRVQKVVC